MYFFGLIFLIFFLLKLLVQITKVTTEHQKWPKMGKHSIFMANAKIYFFGIFLA